MSTSIADMSVRLSASSKDFITSLSQASLGVDQFVVKTDKMKVSTDVAMAAFNRAEATITPYRAKLLSAAEAQKYTAESLKGLKDNMELWQGAGKLAGFTMLGHMAASLGTAIRQASDDLQSGTKSVWEIADATMRAAPLVGGFWSFGRDIRATIDGTTQYERDMQKVAEQWDRNAQVLQQMTQNTIDLGKALDSVRINISTALNIDAAATEFEKNIARTKGSYLAAIQNAKMEYDKTVEQIQKQHEGATDITSQKEMERAIAAAGNVRDEKFRAARVDQEIGIGNAKDADQRGFSVALENMKVDAKELQLQLQGIPEQLAASFVQIDSMTSLNEDEKQRAKDYLQTQYDITDQLRNQVKLKADAVKLQQEEKEKQSRFAESLRNKFKTPVDEIQAQIDEINTALANNQITGTEADSWIGQLKSQLEEIANPDAPATAAARGSLVLKGSAESAMIADAAFRQSNARSETNDKQVKQIELAKDAKTLLQKLLDKPAVNITLARL